MQPMCSAVRQCMQIDGATVQLLLKFLTHFDFKEYYQLTTANCY